QELQSVPEEAEAAGLLKLAHPMTVYAKLVGEAPYHTETNLPDRYMRRLDQYTLPLWPGFAFSVHGSEECVTAGVWFLSRPDAPRRTPTNLVPWQVVEQELQDVLSRGRVVDEWFPQKDYVCRHPQFGDREVVLRFDFGLLQEVSVSG